MFTRASKSNGCPMRDMEWLTSPRLKDSLLCVCAGPERDSLFPPVPNTGMTKAHLAHVSVPAHGQLWPSPSLVRATTRYGRYVSRFEIWMLLMVNSSSLNPQGRVTVPQPHAYLVRTIHIYIAERHCPRNMYWFRPSAQKSLRLPLDTHGAAPATGCPGG